MAENNGTANGVMDIDAMIRGAPAPKRDDTQPDDDGFRTMMQDGKYQPYMDYMTWGTFESLSSQASIFRSAIFSKLQIKLGRHKVEFGNAQKAAPANQFPELLQQINKALKIYNDYQTLEQVDDPWETDVQHQSMLELVATNTISLIKLMKDKEKADKRIEQEVAILTRKRKTIVKRMERAMEDGSYRDYSQLDKLFEAVGGRPLVGSEVHKALKLMPEVHAEVYLMGRSTEGNTELDHTETMGIKQPIRVMRETGYFGGRGGKKKKGGALASLFGGNKQSNFSQDGNDNAE